MTSLVLQAGKNKPEELNYEAEGPLQFSFLSALQNGKHLRLESKACSPIDIVDL